MVSKTNEQALEAAIQRALTGTDIEALAFDSVTEDATETVTPADYVVANNGFRLGLPTDFNAQYAIDEKFFWRFITRTQEDELEKIKRNSPGDWQRKSLERFDRLIKKHGILHLLKKGLSVDDAHFNLMYPAPLASSSEKVKQNFADNSFINYMLAMRRSKQR